MKRRICISSDGDSSMPNWSGKGTKLDTLLEQLIDSVLLMNNKVEGLSNRVMALEEKVNREIMLGRKDRTEFMKEVKLELAKLKEAQEQEQTVFVGSHLVSKLSNLQKLVGNELPVAVDIASKGLDVLQEEQPNRRGTHLNAVQPPSNGSWTDGWEPWQDTYLDGQLPNRRLNVPDFNNYSISFADGEDHWRRPDENFTKVNVGVAFSLKETSAYGVIVRNHLAELKGCNTGYFWGKSLLEADARAYLDGVEFAVKNELDNVVIEGDAQNIVEYLNVANHLVPRCIHYEIARIRELASSIPLIEFRFIKGSANMAANTLASYAKSNSKYRRQVSSPPPIVASHLDADSNCSKNKEKAVVDRDWITDEEWDSE